ncbi:hypothetical protein [Actinomadura rupiterrae]|uniref:hypothetical protein n=1 Tax=Actinomadura rupiterrae TaxID=559627 RepID=UPI0020A3AF34|nr:hypothetical protein [Actinomadura rupiterrae]MCP2339339.1 hypothetical protein [Actinomadura rupiterrae]
MIDYPADPACAGVIWMRGIADAGPRRATRTFADALFEAFGTGAARTDVLQACAPRGAGLPQSRLLGSRAATLPLPPPRSPLPGDDAGIRPWRFDREEDEGAGAPRLVARTTARWSDPVAGAVRAAIVLRDSPRGLVEWGVAAHAERGWTHRAVPPCVRLGIDRQHICDSGGLPVTGEPLKLFPLDGVPPDEAAEDERLVLVAGSLEHAERSIGVLVVSLDSRKALASIDTLFRVHWPGLLSVAVVIEPGRRVLAGLMPERAIPVGGARYFGPSGSPEDDTTFTRAAVRDRHGLLTALLDDALTARCGEAPCGVAAEAAGLLDEVLPRRPRPVVPPPAVEPPSAEAVPSEADRLRSRLSELESVLADTERRARTQLTLLRDEASAAQQARALAEQHADHLTRQLAEALTERDLFAEALDDAEAERDAAVRDRGVLAARLADVAPAVAAAPPPAAAVDRVPGSFEALIAECAARYSLLLLEDLDASVAAALDPHPKAASWRRKARDALTTLDAYARAKQRARRAGAPPGPHLADLLAFVRSGAPGAMISANIIALAESDRVEHQEKFRQARMFPVRPATHPSGRACFTAHIKLERCKPPAPRLHFFDDTDKTGLIYIGYLGPHLATGRTN